MANVTLGESSPTIAKKTELADVDNARRIRLVVSASMIGTIIEWYDFFVYGTAAALVFAPLFFSKASPTVGTLAAFATYALGFAVRPISGAVFGHLGDKFGRKAILVTTLMVMGITTTLIGLLPTYGQIGELAPVLLLVLRLIQGFGAGAEFAGAAILAVEFSREIDAASLELAGDRSLANRPSCRCRRFLGSPRRCQARFDVLRVWRIPYPHEFGRPLGRTWIFAFGLASRRCSTDPD